jgi:MOSC domain-containing protein YiiM
MTGHLLTPRPRLLAVCTGQVAPLFVRSSEQAAPRRVLSGIRKAVVSNAASPSLHFVGPLGLEGDEQCDLTVHGGVSKAVYAYPYAHYAFWTQALAQHAGRADRFSAPGAVGENLSVEGLSEDTVYVGDEWSIGEVVLRVTEPREPCFKFNAAVGWSGAAKAMAQQGCCGWYLSVVTPGVLAADFQIDVRPGPRRLSIQQAFLKKSV